MTFTKMTARTSIFALAFPLLLLSGSAEAAPPDPCSFFSIEELNKLAKGGDAVRAEKSGGPSESQCNWLKKGGDNVMNITIRQTRYAADDLKLMGRVEEARFKKPAKAMKGLGDAAWWGDNSRMLAFSKGEYIVTMYWGLDKYGDEESTVAVGKLVAARLK